MNATLAAEEILYRPATLRDVPALAELPPERWANAPDRELRLANYLSGEHNPRHALPKRVAVLAEHEGKVIGFVAGHLTRRFGCQGEVQWINITESRRRHGVATELLRHLADWFVGHDSRRVCVDVPPRNIGAQAFYTRHGAHPLNDRWLVFPDIATLNR